MAAKLERAVCDREKVRLAPKCDGDKLLKPMDKVEEEHEKVESDWEPTECLRTHVGSLNEFSSYCREFFSKLKTISVESDVEKRIQFLKHAKILAIELVNR